MLTSKIYRGQIRINMKLLSTSDNLQYTIILEMLTNLNCLTSIKRGIDINHESILWSRKRCQISPAQNAQDLLTSKAFQSNKDSS